MVYFAKIRQALQILLKNCFFEINNEVIEQINSSGKPTFFKFKGSSQRFLNLEDRHSRKSASQLKERSMLRTHPIDLALKIKKTIQSEDESSAHDTNIRRGPLVVFPIEEQTESYFESIYDSNAVTSTANDNANKTPKKKRLQAQVSFGKDSRNQDFFKKLNLEPQ